MLHKHNLREKMSSMLRLHFLIMIAGLTSGCSNSDSRELYHRFPDKSWARFNLLSFEIPVTDTGSYNIYFFASLAPDYQYETLDFNMVMNTPAGEERIHEYQMVIKSKTGNNKFECSKDSCLGTILLKKEIYFTKPGVLKIEIENLMPHITTESVLGVGIRLVSSG